MLAELDDRGVFEVGEGKALGATLRQPIANEI